MIVCIHQPDFTPWLGFYDTFGEVTVIFTAGLGVLVLLGFGRARAGAAGAPSAADRAPLSRSSFHSRPGSRKWTCVSMTPGKIWRPRASTV